MARSVVTQTVQAASVDNGRSVNVVQSSSALGRKTNSVLASILGKKVSLIKEFITDTDRFGDVRVEDVFSHSIASTQLLDGSVTSALIADLAVITAKLADLSVTTGKLADLAVTTGKLADLGVTAAKIAAANVDETKLAASVAGSGLTGGAGTALAVNTDGSTLEVNADIVRIKDGGVTAAKVVTNIDLPGNPRASTKACFLAYNGSLRSNVTGDGTLYSVPFDTEVFDQGGDFSGSSFTAPVTGRYLFTCMVATSDTAAGNKCGLFLVTSNRTYATEVWPTSNVYHTISMVVDMDAGDTASVQFKASGGSLVVDVKSDETVTGGKCTWFTGALIA